MKTRGKVLLATLSAAMLVTASVMGTLAYLQDSETVTNTFTVGKVQIDMTETDVDLDGVATGKDRDKANDYKLMPGHDYIKDPIVYVEEKSENAWVFVKVTNAITALETGDDDANAQYDTVATQIEANGWTALDGVDGVYYRSHAKQDTVKEYPVFEGFSVSGSVENGDLTTYEGKTIEIIAYAIQMDGFNDTAKTDAENAKAAWTAGNFA